MSKTVFGILASASLGFIIGLADDSYNTKPLLKFAGQLCCGLILIYSNVVIGLFHNSMLNNLLTLFWVVGIMNSINMLDNMDAISSTVSISIIVSALTAMIFNSQLSSVYFMICIGVLGALIGFLYFNWHPSKMYMGDTGSQFIGVFLAALGIICFWNSGNTTEHLDAAKNLLLQIGRAHV